MYINNIIQIFFNLNRSMSQAAKEEVDKNIFDLLGMLPMEFKNTEKSNASKNQQRAMTATENFLEGTQAYSIYFDDVFLPRPKNEKGLSESKEPNYKEHNYDVMRLLSTIRQCCMRRHLLAHPKDEQKEIVLYAGMMFLFSRTELITVLFDSVRPERKRKYDRSKASRILADVLKDAA